MKNIPRSLSLLLILSMMVGSVSCSAKTEQSVSDNTSAASSETTPGEPADTETTETESTSATTTVATTTTTTTQPTDPTHETVPYKTANLKKKPKCAMDPIKLDQYCYKNNVENAGTKLAFVDDSNTSETTINGTVFSKKELCITDYKPGKDYNIPSYSSTFEYLTTPGLYFAALNKSQWGDDDIFFSQVWGDYFLSSKHLKDSSIYLQKCEAEDMHTYTEYRALKFKNTIYSQYYYRLITDPLKQQKKWYEIRALDYDIYYAANGTSNALKKEECRCLSKEKKNKYYMLSLAAPCMPESEIEGSFALSVGVYKKDEYVIIVTEWIHFDKGDIMDFFTKPDTDFPCAKTCKALGITPPSNLIKSDKSIGTIVP